MLLLNSFVFAVVLRLLGIKSHYLENIKMELHSHKTGVCTLREELGQNWKEATNQKTDLQGSVLVVVVLFQDLVGLSKHVMVLP